MTYTLGILGGSGLYEMEGLEDIDHVSVTTPYGPPSDEIVRGRLGETTLLFLPRHGRGHRIPPSSINYRANICALKKLGATHLLSVSAVGSMKEEIRPGDLVTVDQFIDMTKRRVSTFFDDDVVAHIGFADPVCPLLEEALAESVRAIDATLHRGGTYLCIEGPQFSTRAESLLYRSFGVSVIGMTNMPEAKLAREAELPYATLALATDYDCWHEAEEDVSAEAIVAVVRENVAKAKRAIRELAKRLPDPSQSPATHALRHAVMTSRSAISDEAKARLSWLTAFDG